MKVYQDLLAVGDGKGRANFLLTVINDHKSSVPYGVAEKAEQYYKHLNPTIMQAEKLIYDIFGVAHGDEWSPNHKIPCRYYFYYVTQAVLYLLGNGVGFSNQKTKERLGKTYDKLMVDLVTKGLNGGTSFGFWNYDHLEVFGLTEFAPLYDEETGLLRAGIRFWQIDYNRPLRCTLYEEDGYTEYIMRRGEDMMEYIPKRPYIQLVRSSEATGVQDISEGENYPGFPIIPFYNINKQSELVGTQQVIDAYDLMASTLVNNVDNGNLIYWIIRNAGGMTDMDDQRFIERLKTMHVIHTEGEEEVDAHSTEAPFDANDKALERLRAQICDDFMGLDIHNIASGAATATQIKAAYEPLNAKADLLEGQVTEFIARLLELLEIDDLPTYTRSMVVNQQEVVQTLMTASNYLPSDYITAKVLEIMGDADDIDDILKAMTEEDIGRMTGGKRQENAEEELEATEDEQEEVETEQTQK